MKYSFYLLIALAFTVSACGDNGSCNRTLDIPTLATYGTYNKDIKKIDDFISKQGLVADTTDSGLRYTVDTIGMDRKPDLCDLATVSYEGSMIDGDTLVQFDASDEFTFDLGSNLVEGWKEGMLLIGEQGTTTLYLPSYIGYGVSPPASSGIPINEVLVFRIRLTSF